MKLMITPSGVACPVCDTPLTLVKEQDKRVAHMRHEGQTKCPWYWKDFRVDRLNGLAEEAYGNAQKPTEVQLQATR